MSPPGGKLYNYKYKHVQSGVSWSKHGSGEAVSGVRRAAGAAGTSVGLWSFEAFFLSIPRDDLVSVSHVTAIFNLNVIRVREVTVTCRPHESRCWSDTVWVIKRYFSPAYFLRVNRLTDSELHISEPHGLFDKTQQGGFRAQTWTALTGIPEY